MSDVLLERLAKAAEGILAHMQKSGAPAAGAGAGAKTPPAGGTAPKPDAAAAKAAADKKAAADAKAAADKKAAADAAAKAAAKPSGPPSGTKAPGGKYTIDQVREKIREVATNPSLGRQSATDILDADGGGVKKITDLKPENYDAVYEACQVALQSEGSAPSAASDEDDFG